MIPLEWMQDEQWRKVVDRYLQSGSREPLLVGTGFQLYGQKEPRHPPRILEVGRNLYAPKVLVAIERRSYDCAAPMILELCRDVFKDYEYGQVYYQKFEPAKPAGDMIQEAELVGARLFYFMYHVDKRCWELTEYGGLDLRVRISESQFTMDRRFVRQAWYSARKEPSHQKPKIEESCDCGLCDRCLGFIP